MSDAFSPIPGKCTWWREQIVEEDVWDVRLPEHEKRIRCWCFVEGKAWTSTRGDVPAECPDSRHCRYYIRYYR